MNINFPKYIFLIIIIFFSNFQIASSPNLSPIQKKESPSQIVKKDEAIHYKGLKLQFPFESIVFTVHTQRPYLKIYPIKNELFFLTVREYNGNPSFDNPNLTNLENSFLPNAIFHPSTEYNFVKSFRIKKWSAELVKNGNELNAIVYLVKRENEFYTIWVVYKKYIPTLDSVFQKVDFFTH